MKLMDSVSFAGVCDTLLERYVSDCGRDISCVIFRARPASFVGQCWTEEKLITKG